MDVSFGGSVSPWEPQHQVVLEILISGTRTESRHPGRGQPALLRPGTPDPS